MHKMPFFVLSNPNEYNSKFKDTLYFLGQFAKQDQNKGPIIKGVKYLNKFEAVL
jgi:hypothetical protein